MQTEVRKAGFWQRFKTAAMTQKNEEQILPSLPHLFLPISCWWILKKILYHWWILVHFRWEDSTRNNKQQQLKHKEFDAKIQAEW